MARKKTTVYIDEALLTAVKVRAVRLGQKEHEVFEEALRKLLGLDAVTRSWEKSDLSEKEALDLAYGEIHKSRR
jgi:Arc/MetJ family transcription regulator